jgi:hypothetical protein
VVEVEGPCRFGGPAFDQSLKGRRRLVRKDRIKCDS